MHQKKQIKFPQAKHYYAKCNHPEDRGEVGKQLFDYADYMLKPQDYHAVYITKNNNGDDILYIHSKEIKLEKAEMWDFKQIAENTAKNRGTYTIDLQEQRRTLRNNNSKRTADAVIQSIHGINKKIKTELNSNLRIITNNRRTGYWLNIDKNKPHTICLPD